MVLPGTIINWSNGLSGSLELCTPKYSVTLDNAFGATYAAGMLNVVAAGNDGCNTADNSPTVSSSTFAVGATSSFSAPYVAGIMAVVCEGAGTDCATGDTGTLYSVFKSTNWATSRFIWQQW